MKYYCQELNSTFYKDKTIIEINSLIEAREIFKATNKNVIITNPKGSTKYMGFMVIDYIFDILLKESPFIEYAILQTNGDNAAKFSALKLDYIESSSLESPVKLSRSTSTPI